MSTSRLAFADGLLSSGEPVKHHRSARLPVDKAGGRAHTHTAQRTLGGAFISQLGVRYKPHQITTDLG